MSASANAPHELIAQCQGLVRSIAWKIHRGLPSSVEIDDLIGYGQIGLAEAARDFDPARTGSFTTYAYYRVRGAIYDGLSKMSWFSRAQYARLRYAQRANELLTSENDNAPPADRPVDEDVRWFRDVVSSLAVAYLASASRDDDERGEISLVDSGPLPPGVLMGDEARRIVNELVSALPEQESQLIRAAYFEGLTLQEAGQRLGISKAWASRLHARSLERLGRSLRRLELAD
ncbi:MAG TPA: sigma-70 family RNA polymerase sigma factor [Pirellulales bacterium]|nr:sigma-70 family RNA polymerase sigma factor [Pirellulales bacterium]